MKSKAWIDDEELLAPARVFLEDLGEGSFVLRSTDALRQPVRCIGEWLERWNVESPDALFLAERVTHAGLSSSSDWREFSYRDTRAAVGRIGQWLIDARLDPQRPITILSDNSIDGALLMLAGMHVGLPVCVVSSAYSKLEANRAKLTAIAGSLRPSLVYAADGAVYGAAMQELRAALPASCRFALSTRCESLEGAIAFDQMMAVTETPDVARAFSAITPEDHAKYLLTSGSTGHPKVVINTHRMLCSNQQMILQTWRFLEREKPIVLDWLPWSHTFGGNHNFNLVLANGGALYIDDGRPLPGMLDRTIRNIRAVKPTLYFNVPSGLDALATAMENEEGLARDFFSRLRALFYAAAALPQSTWSRLEALARRVRDEPVWFTSAWGSTETSPLVTSVHWRLDSAGCIGLPAPGMELKFVPNGNKLEMRVRGPSVFPGYLNSPDLTLSAFDEDNFYKIGDAGVLVDEARPERGVAFDGRVAEDFKLVTGTWVSVGILRLKLISGLAPYANDIVIAGQDRGEIGLLIFLSPSGKALPSADLRTYVADAMKRAGEGAGSSQRPCRALILEEPPDMPSGEVTDKGYLNQRAVLARRSALVERLYSSDSAVIHSSGL